MPGIAVDRPKTLLSLRARSGTKYIFAQGCCLGRSKKYRRLRAPQAGRWPAAAQ
ncbi:hypothetical protein QT989_02800 [Microcoleus sp. SVA1_B6]|uniref:hypothetical protein n=1 Tax=Microcoleus sp. SVA1_B6 TaxID=2818952 RepID=UPI002FD32C20